jgi:hypothetical protein
MSDVLVINPDGLPLSPGVNDADSFVQLIGTKLYRCPATLAKAYFEGAGGGGTTLATPTLSLTVISSTQINLSWTNVANESNYELQRSPNGTSGWTTINSPAANVTSFNNTGLTASTAYYYRIRAIGDGVTYLNSPYSSTQNGTTSAPGLTPLSTPTLTATVISSTQIDLSWTNVANESSYRLEWSPNGTSGWTQIGGTIAANTTTYSHTGLTASTAYYYRVKAVGDGVTYSDSGYGTDNDTTSAGGSGLTDITAWSVQTRVTITSGNDILANANSAYNDLTGAISSKYIDSATTDAIVQMGSDIVASKTGFLMLLTSSSAFPDVINNAPHALGIDGNSVTTYTAGTGSGGVTYVSNGWLYRMRVTSTQVHYEYSSTGGASWTTYGSATRASGNLYVAVAFSLTGEKAIDIQGQSLT